MGKAQDAHAIRNALATRESCEAAVQRRLEQGLFHGQVRQATPAEMAKVIVADTQRYSALVKAIGLQLD